MVVPDRPKDIAVCVLAPIDNVVAVAESILLDSNVTDAVIVEKVGDNPDTDDVNVFPPSVATNPDADRFGTITNVPPPDWPRFNDDALVVPIFNIVPGVSTVFVVSAKNVGDERVVMS